MSPASDVAKKCKLKAKTPTLTINVNLCGCWFKQQKLQRYIHQILQETELQPHSLKLEITEDIIMENDSEVSFMLNQLRDLGIKLAIDDFGTGYSSLARLHRFPITELKIDRSFVSGSDVEKGNLDIIETIAILAKKLGMEVTAEGIETAQQLQKLRELKCEYGQGYFFSKPLESKAIEALIMADSVWL